MYRALLPTILLVALVGCSSAPVATDAQERATTERRIARLREQNVRRLAGEDATTGPSTRPFSAATLKKAWEDLKELYQKLTQQHTAEQDIAKLSQPEPDLRREGLFGYVDRSYGRNANSIRLYALVAFGEGTVSPDSDYTVRAAAIRALNRCRAKQYVVQFVRVLNDAREPALARLEAAKALANVPDASTVRPLIAVLENAAENRDIRIAAADALRNHRNFDVAQALVTALQDRDFGVAWQAHRSLVLLTGQDFHYRTTSWLKHLTESAKPFG
jgi:hypothetical protein